MRLKVTRIIKMQIPQTMNFWFSRPDAQESVFLTLVPGDSDAPHISADLATVVKTLHSGQKFKCKKFVILLFNHEFIGSWIAKSSISSA